VGEGKKCEKKKTDDAPLVSTIRFY